MGRAFGTASVSLALCAAGLRAGVDDDRSGSAGETPAVPKRRDRSLFAPPAPMMIDRPRRARTPAIPKRCDQSTPS
jgi:hypothetical protein